MFSVRRRFTCWLVLAALFAPAWSATAGESGFPFERDLMLDTAPMHGSKRVPMLQIEENGAASIDLWCASVRAQATIGDGTISIVADTPQPVQCTPERQSGDDNLLAALSQVTNWKRRGDLIELLGATTLRFRLMTN